MVYFNFGGKKKSIVTILLPAAKLVTAHAVVRYYNTMHNSASNVNTSQL